MGEGHNAIKGHEYNGPVIVVKLSCIASSLKFNVLCDKPFLELILGNNFSFSKG